MKQQRVVIIGAGYAGLLAAFRLAGKADRDITLINASDVFVERIRLHQLAAGQALKQRSIPGMLRDKPVRFVQGWVTALDPDAHILTVKRDAEETRIEYDYLVYALGSAPDTKSVPGVRDNAYAIGTSRSARPLQEALEQVGDGRVIVVGGGLTGIESATEIAETYPNASTTLITAGTVGATLSHRGRTHIEHVFARLGITVQEHTQVKHVEKNRLITDEGTAVPFDICVWAGSFIAPPLARDSGLDVNERGQIRVDEALRSLSHPDIYAAGDAAMPVHMPLRMACATAEPMAAQVADNLLTQIASQSPRPFGFDYAMQCISLGRRDGLIQWVDSDDTPKDRVFTGRFAAWWKEMVSRYAWWAVAMEARWPGLYRWPGANKGETGMTRKPEYGSV